MSHALTIVVFSYFRLVPAFSVQNEVCIAISMGWGYCIFFFLIIFLFLLFLLLPFTLLCSMNMHWDSVCGTD